MSGIPSTIGRYRIMSLLGSGSMGKVYIAEDPTLDRTVALKVVEIDPTLQADVRDAYRSRFSAEAKALARLDHPNIVHIFDTGEENGKPWIAFQLVDGESLETMLSERIKLSVRRALLFTLDIASALQHAHDWNIIHRDVKPENILIDKKTGLATLTDFGIAQASWSKAVETGSLVGSPGYMSPEQIDGKEVDRRSDIFSLGVVLYRMLSGEHPFLRPTLTATIDATCRGDYSPLQNLVPEIPKPLEAAVRRCLFSNYKMRFGSAAEFIDVIKPLLPKEQGIKTSLAHLSNAPVKIVERSVAFRLAEVNSLIHIGFSQLRSAQVFSAVSNGIKKALSRVHT